MDSLKQKRGVEKGNVTRSLTWIHSVDKTTVTVLYLKNKRQIIEGYFKKFEECQLKIEENCANDVELGVQLDERNEFENKYLELVSNLDNIIDELTSAPASPRSSSRRSSTCNPHLPIAVKLPRLDLPKFTGQYEAWTSFMDLFEATVHHNPSLGDVQRLQYLKSAVIGDAASLIKNLQVTASNYAEAWTLLTKRYNNEREIVYAQLRRLFTIQPVKEGTASSIQQVLDLTNESVRALTVLHQPVEHWDSVLVYITTEKLDSETRKQWALQLKASTLPTYKQLCDFLEQHVRGLNAGAIHKPQPASTNTHSGRKTSSHHGSNGGTTNCVVCNSVHPIFKCTKFLALNVNDRNQLVRRHGLCFNCLRPNHRTVDCTSSSSCRVCSRKHHSLLHFTKSRETEEKDDKKEETQPPKSTAHHAREVSDHTDVLLSTAIVKVKDSSGVLQQCRIMLDYGSQASLITERCANALGLKRRWDRTTITGIGMGEVGHTKGKISVKISSMTNDESVEIEALVMKKVTGDIPNYPCEKDWEHLAGVNLADPSYYRPGPVDILLGAEYTTSILRDGRIEGERHSPTAQNTIFGWVLAGRVTLQESKQIKIHHVQCETELIMKRFWELEEIPDPKQYTQDEKFCEEHFLRTHWKDETGRFGVQLPVKENISKLGYSRQQAINRLNQVERRLLRQPEFRLEYNNFMNEYIKLGHMQRIPRGEVTERLGETYYLPHHFVIKPDSTSTKFRVVFDASAKTTTGLSLNDCLGVGKSHQDDIFTLLLKFREHKIVIKADIAKMFRQFNVSDEHADLQRIVWRNSAEDQIEDYKLTTVTYGTASAPFTAVRCLQQLATENKLEHPVAASKLEEDLYVDDLMSGAESSEEAISIVDDLTKITATAGLSLRKWTSNSEDVLAAIPVELRETQLPLSFEKEAKMKALGVQWNPSTDNFSFSELQYQQVSKITKRVVLSQLAKVFDPLGFISPVTIRAKLFLQELWKSELSWDESLTDDMCNRWLSYRESLSKIEELQIPRWVKTSQLTTVQLHGFGDSSLKAYGAVVYLRCENEDGSFSCKMLAAKSKVAPLQTVSLPRLEICAAVLTAQLVTTVKKALKLECEVFAWSDSMITLQWLSAYPGRWDTFVANRVSIIQELIPAVQWNHVKTEDNPADVLSRGISAEELCNNNQWWHGPSWLSTPNLPERSSIKITTNVEEKKRRVIVAHTQTVEAIIQKYSSLQKLKRILVYLLRFIDHYVKKQPIKTGAILPSELNRSMMMIVRSVQHSYFSTELKLLQKDKPVQPSSKLNTLTPFLDIDDVVRVTGRLSNADISYNQKYPMVLPSGSHLTKLLIEDAHLALLHGGVKLLWCHLRLNYWILSGKNTIRFFVRKCVVCIRNRAEKMEQLMGSLPSSRVNITHAFLHSGVDYAGPFNLRVMKGRSNKLFKGYFAIFVCMATKAIHLEAVIDMTTEAFLAALRRFVSRRGVPAVLYSDCGTNFTGADKELKQFLRDDEHNRAVTDDLSGRGIEWKFNPPSSPHHGGLWEAGVKSVKYHLRRVVGNHTLTFEEFATILCQVEACLNSRPLCAISDPEDVEVLTPGHFLTGQALTAIPHPDVSSIKTNRLSRWQYTQQVLQHFWKQWRMEYLSSLQQRFKWKRKCENIKVGDIVIIHEDNVPPMKWKLAKVIEVHGGADDRVRVVSVKTSSGIYKRPIVKLTPILSIDE